MHIIQYMSRMQDWSGKQTLIPCQHGILHYSFSACSTQALNLLPCLTMVAMLELRDWNLSMHQKLALRPDFCIQSTASAINT